MDKGPVLRLTCFVAADQDDNFVKVGSRLSPLQGLSELVLRHLGDSTGSPAIPAQATGMTEGLVRLVGDLYKGSFDLPLFAA